MAGRPPRTGRRGRGRSRREGGLGTRSPLTGLRDGVALRAAQAHAPRDLPGSGVPARGLAVGATFRARRPGAATGQVGPLPEVASAAGADPRWASWRADVAAYDALLARVVDQTRRRVFDGETVPAREKIVSLFEPHTDIIVKGGRGTHYGHKVNLATGRSGLALDVVVEDGNPADSARCLPMLERHVAHYGAAPSHAAFDGRLRHQAEPGGGQGARRRARRVPQETRHEDGGHDAVVLGACAAQALPRRDRGGDLVPEALLRAGLLQLAGPGALQGVRALGRRRPQPDPHGASEPSAGLSPPAPVRVRPDRAIRTVGVPGDDESVPPSASGSRLIARSTRRGPPRVPNRLNLRAFHPSRAGCGTMFGRAESRRRRANLPFPDKN